MTRYITAHGGWNGCSWYLGGRFEVRFRGSQGGQMGTGANVTHLKHRDDTRDNGM